MEWNLNWQGIQREDRNWYGNCSAMTNRPKRLLSVQSSTWTSLIPWEWRRRMKVAARRDTGENTSSECSFSVNLLVFHSNENVRALCQNFDWFFRQQLGGVSQADSHFGSLSRNTERHKKVSSTLRMCWWIHCGSYMYFGIFRFLRGMLKCSTVRTLNLSSGKTLLKQDKLKDDNSQHWSKVQTASLIISPLILSQFSVETWRTWC